MTPISSIIPDPTTVCFGEGSIHKLGPLLDELHAHRVLLIVDRPAYKHSGAEEALEAILSQRETTLFSDFELNPKVEDVERGIACYREVRPDAVIALGGGSTLDMGKLVCNCAVQEGPLVDYVVGTRSLEQRGVPLIAIPTTAGTGSEATHFAVVYVEGEKYSLAHQNLLPAHVLIDPELTRSLPAGTTAASGLDALCQSIESIWAVGATEESLCYGEEALKRVLQALEPAVLQPSEDVRRAMAEAAHLAGKAINISKTTAPHALSYAITTRFHVPHGSAVALTIGAFLTFNSGIDPDTCVDPRGWENVRNRIDHAVGLIGGASIAEARARLESIVQTIGCPVRLSEAGIASGDIAWLAGQVNAERMSNNPRRVDTLQLCRLLESIL